MCIGSLTIYAIYVPTFKFSLLSVSCLDISGHRTTFVNKTCTITSIADCRTILTAHLRNGLYLRKVDLTSESSDFIATVATTLNGSTEDLTTTIATSLNESAEDLWHRRFGHMNYDYIRILFPGKRKQSLPESHRHRCKVCILSKQTHAPHRKTPAERATHPFQLIHSDSCTITTPSLSGSRYYLLFVDNFTCWAFVYFLMRKNAETCTQAFKELLAYICTQYPTFKVQRFRCHNGMGEYDNNLFRELLANRGIIFEPSPPYTQNMNGVSERMIQTLNTRARSMMIDANIPIAFWAEMINTASYLQQRSPTTALKNRTPFEILHQAVAQATAQTLPNKSDMTIVINYTPSMCHLRRIGCVAYH